MEKFAKFYEDRVFIVPTLKTKVKEIVVNCNAFKHSDYTDTCYPFNIKIYFVRKKKYIPKKFEDIEAYYLKSLLAGNCCFPTVGYNGSCQTLTKEEYTTIKKHLIKNGLTFGVSGGIATFIK